MKPQGLTQLKKLTIVYLLSTYYSTYISMNKLIIYIMIVLN